MANSAPYASAHITARAAEPCFIYHQAAQLATLVTELSYLVIFLPHDPVSLVV